MDKSPILSVIIPVYNAEEFLETTLRNVIIDQFGEVSPADWELIIVNDGSTDRTMAVVEKAIADNPNVKVINQSNSGASTARNNGLKIARGEYVYFLDSDDLLLGGVLETVIDVIKLNHPDLIKFCLWHISPEEYRELSENIPSAGLGVSDFKLMSPGEYLNETEAMTNPSGDCTVLTVYRRSVLTNHTLEFNRDIEIGEDVDLIWRAMFCVDSIAYCKRALHLYNLHPGSTSRNPEYEHRRLLAMADHLSNYLKIYRRYQKSPKLVSMGADTGFRNSIRYLSNHIVSQQIISGTSFRMIYHTLKKLKLAGVDIHPGRPRFEKSLKESITLKAKFRRWLVAYILVIPVWLKK